MVSPLVRTRQLKLLVKIPYSGKHKAYLLYRSVVTIDATIDI